MKAAIAPNPVGAGTVVVVGALAALVTWAIFRKKEEPKTPTPSPRLPAPRTPRTPAPSPSPGTGECVVDPVKLDAWALDRGFAAFYAIKSDIPPSLPDLQAAFPAFNAASYDKIVVVTKNDTFWRYNASGVAEAAPDLHSQYCAWHWKMPAPPPITTITNLV